MKEKKTLRAISIALVILFVLAFIVNFSDMIDNKSTLFGFVLTLFYIFTWLAGSFFAMKSKNKSFLFVAVVFWWIFTFIYGVFVAAGVMHINLLEKGMVWFYLLTYLFVSQLLGIRFVVPSNDTPVFLILAIVMTLVPTICFLLLKNSGKVKGGKKVTSGKEKPQSVKNKEKKPKQEKPKEQEAETEDIEDENMEEEQEDEE